MGTVAFDQRSLIINGQREVIVSGAVHYPRSTPGMWPRILRESKRAGLNCIETYVFWEGHEPEEGQYCFRERFDLGYFLDCCRAEGLYVILRVGPYVCAEWNFGGLPWWLIEQPGMVTRTWNEPFMTAMARWVRTLFAQVGDRQFTQDGPVILVQMENEYGNVSQRYGEAGQRYLAWSGDCARQAGVTVPLVMCCGAAADVIESLNGFSVWQGAEKMAGERPQQPLLWTENWPGWYDVWGQPHNLRRAEEIAYEITRFFAVGGTGVNYYMWYGGTNFARDAMFLQTTSYDFDAPLESYALPTPKSRHLQALHEFLRGQAQFFLEGVRGAPAKLLAGDGKEANDGVTSYAFALGEQQLTIVVNATFENQPVTVAGQARPIPGRSALALVNGKEVYRTWPAPATPVRRMTALDVPIRWEMLAEPLPGTGADAGRVFAPVALPHNMLLATRDQTDFGWYRTTVERATAGKVRLTTRVADFLAAWVNGSYQGTTPARLQENRGQAEDFAVELELTLPAGRSDLLLLVTALGLIKGDWMINAPQSQERKGLLAPVALDGAIVSGPWTFSPGLWGERVQLPDPGATTLAAWGPVAAAGGWLRWYRGTFMLPAATAADSIPWALAIGDLFKGTLWLNGQGLGRYWQEPAPQAAEPTVFWRAAHTLTTGWGEPPQRHYLIPADWLRAGVNTLVICEECGRRPDGCQLVQRQPES